MIPTASSLALAFSTLLYVIVWIGAPSFAALSGNPDATSVVRLLTAVILIEGFTAVRSGVLQREFRQDRVIAANVCGLVIQAAVAIALAIRGWGAMSLAAGQVAGAVVIGVIVFVSAGIPFRLGRDPVVARRLLAFGLPLAAGLAVEAILLNADFIIIGAAVNATNLGYYLLAFNISSWALTSITMSIRYVSVPSFSRISELGQSALSTGAQRSISTLYKVVLPVGTLTAVLATEIVVVLYGDVWRPAADVLRFLAVLTIVRVLISLALDILMGSGSTRRMLWINGVWAAVLIPALYVGVQLNGIRGAGVAHAVVGLAARSRSPSDRSSAPQAHGSGLGRRGVSGIGHLAARHQRRNRATPGRRRRSRRLRLHRRPLRAPPEVESPRSCVSQTAASHLIARR
jgi:PST family polysaccharide transporter